MKDVFILPIPIEIQFLIFKFEHKSNYKLVLSELIREASFPCIDIYELMSMIFTSHSIMIHGERRTGKTRLANKIIHILQNNYPIYEVLIFNCHNIHEIDDKLIEIFEEGVNSDNRIIVLDCITKEIFKQMNRNRNFDRLIHMHRHYNVRIIIKIRDLHDVPLYIRSNMYRVIQT